MASPPGSAVAPAALTPARRQTLLALAVVALLVLLWSTWVVWPLKVLVVLFHELSHALAALATGGRVARIELAAAEDGACWTAGGNGFVVISAGYLGSLGFGALALLAAPSRRAAGPALLGLGGVIVVAALLWVRPIVSFGFAFALLAGAALAWAGARLGAAARGLVLRVVGLTSCLYVLPDVWSDTIARSGQVSDARMLAELTGVPTLVWGALWLGLALWALVALARRELRG